MAQLPSFATLVKSYPYKPKGLSHRVEPVPPGALALGNRELIDRIGGQMKKTLAAVYEDLDRINSCATRMSWCLNQAGATLTKNPHVRMLKGGDGNLYVISADEMIAYLRLTYGKPVLIFDGAKDSDEEWLGTVKPPIKGIFGYDWQGPLAEFGATGHVDIGRMQDADVDHISDIGTGAYFNDGLMRVYFWKTK
jgi:hypothetical protein